MSINRFDKSERPEYVSNRIQLPFEELNAIARNQQKSFDDGKAIEDDLGALGNAIQAAPMHQQDRMNFINKYKSKIDALSGNGNVNYADPAFKRKATNLVNEFKNDPNYQSLKGTLEAYKIYEKRKAETGSERDLDFSYERNPDNSFKQVSSLEKGIYSPKFTKYEDAYNKQSQILGNVASDGSGGSKGYDFSHPLTNVGPGGEYNVYNKVTGRVDKLDHNKMMSIVQSSVPLYAKSDAGLYELQTEAKKFIGDKAYDLNYDKLNELAKNNETFKGILDNVNNKFYTDMLSVGKKQEFKKTFSEVENMQMHDRAKAASNDNKEEKPEPGAIPLNSGVPNPDPDPNKLQTDFKNANPDSPFSFNTNGTMNHIKVGDTGITNNMVYTDKSGKIWDPKYPPSGWTYKAKPGIFGKDDGGVFKSAGGYEFRPITTDGYTTKSVKVSNAETLKKQMTEVLSWGAVTGQPVGKDGLKSYNELLPKYESAMRNGILNSQNLPAPGKGLQDAFAAMYFPEVNADGEVTKAGNTSGWIIDGKQAVAGDLAGAKLKLFDINSGKGDNVIITGKDGIDHKVEMNDPTLEDNMNRLTTFNKSNRNLILNPVANKLSPLEEKTRKTDILDGIGNEFFQYAKQQAGGILSDDQIKYVGMGLTRLQEDLDKEASYLTKDGYSYGENYTDPKTKLIATSYINHKTGDVKVVVLNLQNNEITTMPSDEFGKKIVQSTIGNWNANINDMSKETGVNYNNQEGK